MILFKRNRNECIILLPKTNALRTKKKQKENTRKNNKESWQRRCLVADDNWCSGCGSTHTDTPTHTPVENNLEIFVKRKEITKNKIKWYEKSIKLLHDQVWFFTNFCFIYNIYGCCATTWDNSNTNFIVYFTIYIYNC